MRGLKYRFPGHVIGKELGQLKLERPQLDEYCCIGSKRYTTKEGRFTTIRAAGLVGTVNADTMKRTAQKFFDLIQKDASEGVIDPEEPELFGPPHKKVDLRLNQPTLLTTPSLKLSFGRCGIHKWDPVSGVSYFSFYNSMEDCKPADPNFGVDLVSMFLEN